MTTVDSRARVVVVRHGQTEWSSSGRHTSVTDVPLTREGRRQAAELGSLLRGVSFARVLTSPMQRARETCRLAGLGDEASTVDGLMEWDYGDYEGMTTSAIRAERPGWLLWRDGAPGGETAGDVARRVDAVISSLRSGQSPSIVFAHGHVLRVLGARWVGLPPEDGSKLELRESTMSILGYERELPVISLWNSSSPLSELS